MKHTMKTVLLTALMATTGVLCAQNSKTTTKIKPSGIEMVETLNEDGTDLIKRPYRWFAGMAEADVESIALKMAQLEAYATISQVIENAVFAESERKALVMDGESRRALTLHWKQVSSSIQRACEPFGEAESTFDEKTGLYHVTAKVGIRGDRYIKLLDGAANFKPANLSGDDLQKFIDANQAIINASKGN